MATAMKLKQCMMFNEGQAFIGETVSITPPKLVRKLEDYRAGGMDRPIKIDMGGEPLEMEAVYGGPMRPILAQYQMLGVGGVYQRFVGSYQDDGAGSFHKIEMVTRGRHEEIDLGEWKPGEAGEFKVKSQLSYLKITMDDVELCEIDVLGMISRVNGVDMMAPHRSAFGLS
ncbi:MAG: phage major tail tube protein [Sphingomonas pseudosanguinis]|uniref:phage major tail tube protein n=1 Tax=Sphingomonas pseudosanguinis TaxID=413712 RepID=UPI00391D577E